MIQVPWPAALMLSSSSLSMAPNSTSTWMMNFAAMRLPSIYAPFETCSNMSLMQAADDSSKADNKVHIRLTFFSRVASASRACSRLSNESGPGTLDLFDRETNLTFQYYISVMFPKTELCESYNTLDANAERSHFSKSQQIVSISPSDTRDIVRRTACCNGNDSIPVHHVHNNYLVVRIRCRIANT